MLRIIQTGSGLPVSYTVDPTAEFQPGQIAQLKVMGNEVVCGVSDGTAPLGIIDDINTSAFTAPVNDMVIIIPCVGIDDGYGNYFSVVSAEKRIEGYSNVVRSSFVADVPGLILHDINGVIEVPEGTQLNYDADGDGIKDSMRIVISFIYKISNIPGDNTTIGSNKITVWFSRGVYETDQYDTTAQYVLNATLYCNLDGFLTTNQPSPSHPGVAMLTGPPTALNNTIEFMWM